MSLSFPSRAFMAGCLFVCGCTTPRPVQEIQAPESMAEDQAGAAHHEDDDPANKLQDPPRIVSWDDLDVFSSGTWWYGVFQGNDKIGYVRIQVSRQGDQVLVHNREVLLSKDITRGHDAWYTFGADNRLVGYFFTNRQAGRTTHGRVLGGALHIQAEHDIAEEGMSTADAYEIDLPFPDRRIPRQAVCQVVRLVPRHRNSYLLTMVMDENSGYLGPPGYLACVGDTTISVQDKEVRAWLFHLFAGTTVWHSYLVDDFGRLLAFSEGSGLGLNRRHSILDKKEEVLRGLPESLEVPEDDRLPRTATAPQSSVRPR